MMTKRFSLVSLLAVLVVLAIESPVHAGPSLAGSYRCWMYNVSGAGGSCRGMSPIVLNKDGTYQMSSERGTYRVEGDQIFLSESKIRGAGRLQNGNQMVFEYMYLQRKHTVTYLCENCTSSDPGPVSAQQVSSSRRVPVDITVRFPAEYGGYAGWINTASLLPETESAERFVKDGTAQERYDALAVTEGKDTVHSSFRAVPTGRVYTFFVSTGTERRPLATLDLNHVEQPVQLTLNAPPLGRAPDQWTPPRSDAEIGHPLVGPPVSDEPGPPGHGAEPPPTVSPPAQGAAPCNPNIPGYAQPGCKETGTSPAPPPPPGAAPCNPNIPRYAQPGCKE